MTKIVFVLLIAIHFLSCSGQKTRDPDQKTSKRRSTLVIINRTGNRNEEFSYIDHFNNSQLYPFINSDTLHIDVTDPIVFYSTNTPDFSDLRYFIIRSSDTVSLIKKNGRTTLSSNNSILQNRIDLMDTLLFNVGSMNYSNKTDFITGIKAINKFYASKKQILENRKNTLHNDVYKDAKSTVEYDKLAGLLSLYARFLKNDDNVLTSLKNADSTSWNYLTFRNVINNYILYINKVHHISSTDEYINDMRKNLPPAIQDYAIYGYLKNYKPDTKAQLDTLIEQIAAFNKVARHPDLANYLTENLEKYRSNLQAKLSKNVELKSLGNNKVVNLEQLLGQSKGNVIYLDFWASWCAPCLSEMPASHSLAEKYKTKGAPIVFLYLSKDEDMSAWKHKAKDIGLPDKLSFILLKNAAFTDFSNKLNLKTIPRYMIIDKKGDIVDQDAPRPSDSKLEIILNHLLSK